MTALPASTIGMVDRGFLAPGMAADVTVFDPKTVIDHATYEDPARLSDGIRHVLVNGRLALRDGAVTGERAGRVLARSAHMPSRPMNTSTTARSLSVRGTLGIRPTLDDGSQVALDITHAAGAPRAKGSFRITDPRSNTVVEAAELGVLQTTPDWASFTAVIRQRSSGEESFVTVIVERADPFAAGHPVTVTLDVNSAGGVSRTLRQPARAIVIR